MLDSLVGSLQAELSPHRRHKGQSQRFEAGLHLKGE